MSLLRLPLEEVSKLVAVGMMLVVVASTMYVVFVAHAIKILCVVVG
jgi:hypothetical protein